VSQIRLHIASAGDWSWAIAARQMGIPTVAVEPLSVEIKERLEVLRKEVSGLVEPEAENNEEIVYTAHVGSREDLAALGGLKTSRCSSGGSYQAPGICSEEQSSG
jgi:hypothetical protein